jgi:autophagy-related protein 17
MVEATFRPAGEKPRTLLDFVDEEAVETMRTNLKETIDQSQVSVTRPSASSQYLRMIRKHKGN